ncbi:MAG TPA: hypothetical protein VFZ52_22645, partial [Chryseolinea sp.]
SGVLTFKDQTTWKGYVFHDEKFRSIKFRKDAAVGEGSTIAEGRLLSMEYQDAITSKTRKFCSWDVEEDANTIQGPALYEVVLLTKKFIVLSRKYAVLPAHPRARDSGGHTGKIEYDQVEKIFLAPEDGQGRLLWLGPVYSSGQGEAKMSQVNPFFDGNVLKKFTGSHWRQIKSFVKKRRLTLKHKPELMETLLYFQKLELDADSRSPY